jgi:hypothetical protein
MAQTNFTPISLYYSATATNVPSAANLVAGELAINTADGKLFYKDSAGVVQVIGTKGGVGSATNTQVLYNSSGLVVGSANLTFNGTTLTAGGLTTTGATSTGTFSASGVATFSAGSVSAPAITTTGDTNTGIFFPAADTIAFTEGGVESMRITSAGDVGIGTASPFTNASYTSLTIGSTKRGILTLTNASAANVCQLFVDSANVTNLYGSGAMALATDNTVRMAIDTAGNVGINTVTPTEKLEVFSAGTVYGKIRTTSGGAGIIFQRDTSATTQWLIGHGAASANANFEIYTTGAGDVNFQMNGSERMRITSAGNVGIGTSSPGSNGLSVNKTSGTGAGIQMYQSGTETFKVATDNSAAYVQAIANIPMQFYTNNTERMRITSGGDVGIGTGSPATTLDVSAALPSAQIIASTGTNRVWIRTTNTGGDFYIGRENSAGSSFGVTAYSSLLWSQGAYPMVFATNGTERMRIDSSGNLLVGTTSGTQSRIVKSINGDFVLRVENSLATNPYVLELMVPTASANDTSYAYLICRNADGTNRAVIFGNGNIQNTNNSYGALSDIKLKENIVDATPKLEQLCQVKIRNYNLIGDTTKQIGVVAQELEQIFPSMVEENQDKDAEGNYLETTTKGVKYSVFVPMLIKAMQEQQAMIENLTTRLNALEGK